jgi:hypothetical protein
MREDNNRISIRISIFDPYHLSFMYWFCSVSN